MTRAEKAQIIDELKVKFEETPFFYFVDASGLTVAEVNAFRRLCHQRGIRYGVYKNSLIKKALAELETDYTPFHDQTLRGFSGIMFSPEAANTPAKIIQDYRKKAALEKPEFKGASIDSDLYIGPEHLKALSELKSKQELIGEVITLLQSPISRLMQALDSGKSNLAGVIKTLSEKES